MDIDTLIEAQDLTWRDILYEIIQGMNPWDIDISELAGRYAQRVRGMQEMNFRMPANVVLVSSVLLRMKADILNPHEPEPYTELEDSFKYIFGEAIPEYSIYEGDGDGLEPNLVPKRVPIRRVTAVELIEAIQKALEERGRKKSRLLEHGGNGGEDPTFVIPRDLDLPTLIEETHRRVIELLSGKKVVLFSELARTRDEIIQTLLSLLHLSNDERLYLNQDQPYGEIYIRGAALAD